MALDDAVVIQVRTDGASRASGELRGLEGAVKGLGGAASVAGRGFSNLRQNINMGSTAAYAMRRTAYVTGTAVAGLGALAVKSGIQFNATMEQNRVAFAQFLGSTQAANRELKLLYHTAAVTPFETQQITEAARQMMAFGFTTQQTNGWLTTVADTISGIGGSGEDINRMVLALGQIKSKGVLQGQELLQLEQLGIVNTQDLSKRLGLTPQQLHSGNVQIDATKALTALQSQWGAKFGGMSAKQSQTFSGQASTLHDNINMALGTATLPLFNTLRTGVLPALNASGTDINRIFGRKDLDMSSKFSLSEGVLRQRMEPFVHQLDGAIGRAHLPERIGAEFGRAIPYMAAAAAKAGPAAAKAFTTSFLHSGPWGQFLSLAYLGHKAGAFGALGKTIGGRLGGGGGVAGALVGRGSPTNPLYVVTMDPSGVPGLPGGSKGGGGFGGWLRRAGHTLRPAALLGDVGLMGGAVIAGGESVITGHIPGWVPGIGGRNLTDPIIGGRHGSPGGVQMGRRNMTASVSRGHYLGRITVVHSHVYLNGREIAGAVAQEALDAHARRGR